MATTPSSRRISRHPAPLGAGCFVCCALVAAALAAPRRARADAPRASAEFGAGILRFDYAEYGPTGVRLDRESGFVPVTSAAVQLDAERWFARCAASVSDGDVRYVGRTQSNNAAFNGLPVESTSAATFFSVDARGGARFLAGGQLAAYGGVAARWWRRSIRPTTATSASGVEATVDGMRERYRWAEPYVGARWAAVRSDRGEVALDARVLATVAGQVAVDAPGGAVELALAPRPGARVGAEGRLALGERWYVAVEAHAAVWAFGASDVRSGYREPDSVTRTVGVEARIGAAF